MGNGIGLTFDAREPQRLGDFWAIALGYTPEPPPEGFDTWEEALHAWGRPREQWGDFYAVADPEGAGLRLFFQRVPEAKTAKNRLHIDVVAPGSVPGDREQTMSAARAHARLLVEAGATVVTEFDDEQNGFWIVMQDPEGNEFCVA